MCLLDLAPLDELCATLAVEDTEGPPPKRAKESSEIAWPPVASMGACVEVYLCIRVCIRGRDSSYCKMGEEYVILCIG